MTTPYKPIRPTTRSRFKEGMLRYWLPMLVIPSFINIFVGFWLYGSQTDHWIIKDVLCLLGLIIVSLGARAVYVLYTIHNEDSDTIVELDGTVAQLKGSQPTAANRAEVVDPHRIQRLQAKLAAAEAHSLNDKLFAQVEDRGANQRYMLERAPNYHLVIFATIGEYSGAGQLYSQALIAQLDLGGKGAFNGDYELAEGLCLHFSRTASGEVTVCFYERGAKPKAMLPSLERGLVIKIGGRYVLVEEELDPAHAEVTRNADNRESHLKALDERVAYTAVPPVEKHSASAPGARTSTSEAAPVT